MDNVLIQPHISAASPHYMQLFVEELAKKIRDLNKSNFRDEQIKKDRILMSTL